MATAAYVLVNVEPGAGSTVRQEILKKDGVHFVALVTGPYDLLVGVSASDNEALGDLVSAIRAIDGVLETLTAVIVGWGAGHERGRQAQVLGVIGPP